VSLSPWKDGWMDAHQHIHLASSLSKVAYTSAHAYYLHAVALGVVLVFLPSSGGGRVASPALAAPCLAFVLMVPGLLYFNLVIVGVIVMRSILFTILLHVYHRADLIFVPTYLCRSTTCSGRCCGSSA
jgi:hypothetical protein